MADIKSKSMYQEPRVEVCAFDNKEDVLTTSGGRMSWQDAGGGWDDFIPTRDNTFFGE